MAKSKVDKSFVGDIKNKKAFHNFFVEERFEAGIVLTGTEVKAIRAGCAQITESFVKINKHSEVILFNTNISEYSFGNISNHETTRTRKLLLHRSEIKKLKDAIEKKGLTVLPLKIFLSHGLIKVEIAICRGKKFFDKREVLKSRTELREAQRMLSKFRN